MSKLQISVISTGLEHVTRGVETWANELYAALRQKGCNVYLFKGSGENIGRGTEIKCSTRGSKGNDYVRRVMPKCFWRLGLTSAYDIEQTTFSISYYLRTLLAKYDIIHTQDPWLAKILDQMGKLHLTTSRVILAHGTEEEPDFLKSFRYLQHLAPWHQDELFPHKNPNTKWFSIPNFIDVEKFCPTQNMKLRKSLNIPEDAVLFLSVASIKKSHKRVDYLIKEFASFKKEANTNSKLLIAGSSNPDTDELKGLARDICRDDIIFLTDRPHSEMPGIFAAGDVFVLGSIKEMMPIALLEALGSGLPVITNQHPVMMWMGGEGGEPIDMSKERSLCEAFKKYLNKDFLNSKSKMARDQAVRNFSKDVVIDQILNMYEQVMIKE